MTYVDGFVLAVPTKNLDTYRNMAEFAGKIWIEHGALEYIECIGEDMEDKGFCSNFPSTINLLDDETVVFSYIVYESREHRDRVNQKVMADERLRNACDPQNMPFEPKRMSYGGFQSLVALRK